VTTTVKDEDWDVLDSPLAAGRGNYCRHSIWLYFNPKLFCQNRIYFETIPSKMFTADN